MGGTKAKENASHRGVSQRKAGEFRKIQQQKLL